MTDIKPALRPLASPLFLRDEDMKQGMDLMVLAVRTLSADADALLKEYGLGRAHARAISMIAHRPCLSVAELLGLLHITKQSLNRVLGDLVARDYVVQQTSAHDRRKRLLRLTDKGRVLESALWEAGKTRVARAFRAAGPEAVTGFRKVIAALAQEPRR
jgi:DNA-binding MarR family transcriptional regulator